MSKSSAFFFGGVVTLGLSACGTGDPPDLSAAFGEEDSATLAQDLSPGGAVEYVLLRRDTRRCAAPRCGGFFVRRVNHLTTLCSDGSRAEECYVADLDLAALGLSAEQEARVEADPDAFMLRGELSSEVTEAGEFGRFDVSEAWQGHSDLEPRGAFVRVRDTGLVCITTPCLSLTAELLERQVPTLKVAALDLEGISEDSSDAVAQLRAEDGLLVSALPTLEEGPAGRALGLDATEYYVPLLPEAGAVCGTRGGAVCSDPQFCDFPIESQCGRADGPGVCTQRPEFCSEIFAPVCGCDGQTYGNSCFAAAAGVSVESSGECAPPEPTEPQACGSRGLPECDADRFCSFPAESDCGRADAPGVCAQRPEACIQIFDPVCGCDGNTYGNSCDAASAGISVDFAGACEDVPN
jgi:hypothetical protein